MLNGALLVSIAQQMMNGNTVDVNGKPVPVRCTSRHRLRTPAFTMDGREYQAIEQNPDKPGRWGQLAREGHREEDRQNKLPSNASPTLKVVASWLLS